ncbi:MAG: hypothetical protein II397_13690, partial [Treponema sp.]|nr:hypothetical protein [Treponema sp.]
APSRTVYAYGQIFDSKPSYMVNDDSPYEVSSTLKDQDVSAGIDPMTNANGGRITLGFAFARKLHKKGKERG